MVAPKKLSTKTRQENAVIANCIVKTIRAIAKKQKEEKLNVVEVKVEVNMMGHGLRPFGTHFPNDFIDFSISVNNGAYKADGLGSNDIALIGAALRIMLGDKFDIEYADLYFSYGNFTPDMVFPTYFRKFGTPCKEFKQLAKLVKSKCDIELKPSSLKIGSATWTAYCPNACEEYISEIKSYGRKQIICAIEKTRYGTDLVITLK